MRTIIRENVDVFVSDDEYVRMNESEDIIVHMGIDGIIPFITRDSCSGLLQENFIKIRRALEGKIAIVLAHGGTCDQCDWVVCDGDKSQSMQAFVTHALDGKYSGIFIFSCNPANATLAVEKSAFVLFCTGNVQRRIYSTRQDWTISLLDKSQNQFSFDAKKSTCGFTEIMAGGRLDGGFFRPILLRNGWMFGLS